MKECNKVLFKKQNKKELMKKVKIIEPNTIKDGQFNSQPIKIK